MEKGRIWVNLSDLLLMNKIWWKWCCVNFKAGLEKATQLLPGSLPQADPNKSPLLWHQAPAAVQDFTISVKCRWRWGAWDVVKKPSNSEHLGGSRINVPAVSPHCRPNQPSASATRHVSEPPFKWFQPPTIELSRLKPGGQRQAVLATPFLSIGLWTK